MFRKKLLFTLIVFIIAVSAVSANDLNETADTTAIDEIEDNLEITQESSLTTTHEVNGNTFSDIQNTINSASAGDTISLKGTYSTNGERINIDKTLTIEGSSATLDGKNSSGIFAVNAENVIIKNVKFINANNRKDTVESGGAIYANYDCTISQCQFKDCISKKHGGAIEVTDNSQVIGSRFENCQSGEDGGGMYHGTAVNCDFLYCSAGRHGGGAANGNVNNSNFISCHAKDDGGATSECNAFQCGMVMCTADRDGGAMYLKRNQQAISCIIKNCSAGGDGGAVFGGFVFDCTFSHNSQPETCRTQVGNIEINEDGAYVVNDGSFSSIQDAINLAKTGDTIVIVGKFTGIGTPITVSKAICLVGKQNAVLDGNKLSMILSIDASNVILANLTFTNGFVDRTAFYNNYDAGAVQATGNNIIVENCRFYSNQGFLSGAVELNGDSNTIRDCSFEKNTVALENGAKYTKIKYDGGRRKDIEYTYLNTAGAIILQGNNGLIDSCKFKDNEGHSDCLIVGENNIIKDAKPILTIKDLTKTYGSGAKLTVYLKDNNGNPIADANIKVDIGTTSKTIKTNSNGQATMAITNTPGTYTATATCMNAQATAKIKVNPSNVKITASKKTYKVKATKKYTVTLKDSQNKIIKNEKVTLKVNKKTYTAKTNSKGQATFTLKLTKKGTFTAKVTHAKTKCYNAKTVSTKITIK